MSLIQKINERKKDKKLTNKQISELSGIPLGTLDKITSGITTDPKIQTLKAIANVLDCSLNDFYEDEYNTVQVPYSVDESEYIKKYRALDIHGKKIVDFVLNEEFDRCNPKIKVITRPYYSIPVSAGLGNPLDDSPEEELEIEDTIEHRRGDFVVKVSGDSMKPNYNNGDLVLVQKQPTIEIGEIGIFVLNGESYIKKLGVNELISLNAKYLPKPYTAADSILCCGKVICKL